MISKLWKQCNILFTESKKRHKKNTDATLDYLQALFESYIMYKQDETRENLLNMAVYTTLLAQEIGIQEVTYIEFWNTRDVALMSDPIFLKIFTALKGKYWDNMSEIHRDKAVFLIGLLIISFHFTVVEDLGIELEEFFIDLDSRMKQISKVHGI